jgi:hypothetical protein
MTPKTPRDKMVPDHEAVDNLYDILKDKGGSLISPSAFSDFLKTRRGQNDPRTIAKEYTYNISGLVSA